MPENLSPEMESDAGNRIGNSSSNPEGGFIASH